MPVSILNWSRISFSLSLHFIFCLLIFPQTSCRPTEPVSESLNRLWKWTINKKGMRNSVTFYMTQLIGGHCLVSHKMVASCLWWCAGPQWVDALGKIILWSKLVAYLYFSSLFPLLLQRVSFFRLVCGSCLQLENYRCSAQCCENSSISPAQRQQCIERCSMPVRKAEEYVHSELQGFQVIWFSCCVNGRIFLCVCVHVHHYINRKPFTSLLNL